MSAAGGLRYCTLRSFPQSSCSPLTLFGWFLFVLGIVDRFERFAAFLSSNSGFVDQISFQPLPSRVNRSNSLRSSVCGRPILPSFARGVWLMSEPLMPRWKQVVDMFTTYAPLGRKPVCSASCGGRCIHHKYAIITYMHSSLIRK